MLSTEWAVSQKASFVQLQADYGIPAIFAAAQHKHEGFNADGTMSGLARDDFNFAGIKWSKWERAYGCTPVTYPTTEYINGVPIKVNAQFCHCPTFDVWLKVYADLLTSDPYKDHLQYKADPMLYGYMVGRTWATDPVYVIGIANAMAVLWSDYADTLPLSPPPPQTVTVLVDGINVDCAARLENSRTVGILRPVIEAVGGRVGWSQATRTLSVSTRHLL